ncbi:Ig-like domain-containing protein, partial [Magnetococcales bacterium HHB-1]
PGGSFTGNLKAFEWDKGNSGVTYSVASDTSEATLSIESNGFFTYTADPNNPFIGIDQFRFTATDSDNASSEGIIRVITEALETPLPDGEASVLSSVITNPESRPVISTYSKIGSPSDGSTFLSWISESSTSISIHCNYTDIDDVNNKTFGYASISGNVSSDDFALDHAWLDDGKLAHVYTFGSSLNMSVFAGLSNGDNIFSSSIVESGSFHHAHLLSSEQLTTQIRKPQIVSLSNGEFFIAWQGDQPDSENASIHIQRFNASFEKVGSLITVGDVGENNRSSQIVKLTDGSLVLAWQSEDDVTANDIYFQRMDSSGAFVGGVIRANTHNPGDQTNPVLTALTDGGFVLVWQSEFQD